jgi:hypothetical protein
MAWSWLRRRLDRPSVPAPAANQPPAAAPVRPLGDWQELPAVQRTLQPLSPVAPLDAFTTSLAAHQNPSFLGPLGHRVDPDGPGGLVSGLTSVRPANHAPYAASTALAVPTSSKPRPAVQRRAITWSTATEENPGPGPEPATGGVANAEISEVVTPAPPAGWTVAQPTQATPATATEPHPAAAEDPASGPEFDIVDAGVVTPEPAPATVSEGQVVPLLGAPDIAANAATTEAKPDPPPARPHAPTGPVPVSRLAKGAGAAQPPAGRPAAGAQPRASERGQPGVPPPTILSAATPVPSLQRQLAAVPEHGRRTGVLPPPFTVELPVVARAASEPPSAAGLRVDGPPFRGLLSDTPPTDGLTAAPDASPEPAQAAGLPTHDLPTAPRSSPELAPATDPVPADGRPESEAFGSEPAEPTAPLSGFAQRIASLTNPSEDARPAGAPDPLAPPPAQRLVGPATPQHKPPAAPARSPEPGVVPTVSRIPLTQRVADPTAGPGPEPAHVSSTLPTAPAPVSSLEPVPTSPSTGPDLPLPEASPATPATPATPGDGLDLATPVGGGVTSAPGAALPVVARLTSIERTPATPPPRPQVATDTAALVPHRPALAVRSDLGSAGAPAPAVQRVSFPGTGQPSTSPSEARAAVQRMPATPDSSVLNRAGDNAVALQGPLRTVIDEPPVVPGLVTTGRAARRLDPIPVQRRSAGLPATPAASLLASPAGSAYPAAMPPTIGTARSFAAMFGTASAGPAAAAGDDHPGYTTVQLQTAAEAPVESPPPDEPTAAPAAQPPVETAAPPPAAAATAGPGGAPPTAGAAAADLDEMARRLFEPLSARLRAELWLDRERAGLVTDARH